MRCSWTAKRLGRYVDLDLATWERILIRLHLGSCSQCHARYEALEPLGGWLATSPGPEPSSQLEVKILSALSVEALHRKNPWIAWHQFKLRLRNLMRPVAVPALGGLLIALVVVPTLLSAFWMEPTARANDIPLRLLATPVATEPVMTRPSPYPVGCGFTVLAYIDARGAVYDYFVAGGEPPDERMRGELASVLLTSVFEPAQRFGRPVPGKRVILFQRISSEV